MGNLTHTDQLFCGKQERVIKSHCCLCHNPIGILNKEHRGNCCVHCESRANHVSKGLLTEAESDEKLLKLSTDLQEETWWIDGVQYTKLPDGKLIK